MAARATLTSAPAADAGRTPAGTSRAVYIGRAPNRTLAHVHLPESGCTRLEGVVFCSPLSWDDECTYRTRRIWAREITRAGYPAIRLDLPGFGDSAGSPRSPGRLEAWLEATTAAADWLRLEAGCTRVAAIGIGFGGMLAWLAAARGAPIDDLALWAVPLRGRQLVREIRAAALISIDRDVRLPAAPAPPGSPFEVREDELLDEGGQVLTRETLESLSAIDLSATELARPEERRVLLFSRTGSKSDEAVREHLGNTGVQLTVASGDEFPEMMQYVQESVAPRGAIRSSLSWLARCDRSLDEPHPVPPATRRRPEAAPSLELVHNGVEIRERPVLVQLSSGPMFGIITEPVGVPSADITALFFSGGSDRRIGPNRMWVDLARSWAARGVVSARLDLVGVGDSDGDERRWAKLASHYAPSNLERSLELLDRLEELGLPGRFVITGFCSGAYRAFHAGLNDRRVAGVFAIALPFFRWTWPTISLQANHGWLLNWKPGAGEGRAKVATARVLRQLLRSLLRAHAFNVSALQWRRGEADRAIEQLRSHGTELLVVVKRESFACQLLSAPMRAARVRGRPRLEIGVLPSDDLRFRPLPVREWLHRALDGALERVLSSSAPAERQPVERARGERPRGERLRVINGGDDLATGASLDRAARSR